MRTFNNLFVLATVILSSLLFNSCREEVQVDKRKDEKKTDGVMNEIKGFYLLNEGNMGSNKASLDYFDYEEGVYSRNIFGSVNPGVVKGLGDVGNDLKIYGNKLYAVINCSRKVVVMNKWTAKKEGEIEIPNCRYINFHEGYAYVTSYAGPVIIDPEYEQLGYVAKIDTSTLEIVDKCLVGFQPDEIEIVGNKIYVANSGGYMEPNYENTVSVIDINSFTETKRIEVAINLHRLRADKHGNLWVSSRGDYYDASSKLYCVNTNTDILTDSLDIAVSNFHLDGDSLYICSTEWSYIEMDNVVTYGIVDVVKKEIVTRNFITDGTEQKIIIPYGISVNPITKEIYIADGRNYVSPGTLYCFDKEGKLNWWQKTGDIPAHFAFLYE